MFFWRQEEYCHANHNDDDADKLLWCDFFLQDEPCKEAGADGFAKDTHGHGGSRNFFQKQIEYELTADGRDQRKAEESLPCAGREPCQRVFQNKDINKQDDGAGQITHGGVSDCRNIFSHGFPYEEIQGDHACGNKGDDITEEGFSADLEITGPDDDTAAEGDETADQGRKTDLLLADEAFQSQREQRLQTHKDSGTGDGCKLQRFKPEHIMQGKKEAGGKDLFPLMFCQGAKFCAAGFAAEKSGQQHRSCDEKTIERSDGRRRRRNFYENGGCGQSKNAAK